jgi:hypothetical protein
MWDEDARRGRAIVFPRGVGVCELGGWRIVGGWLNGLVGRWLPALRLCDFGFKGVEWEVFVVWEAWRALACVSHCVNSEHVKDIPPANCAMPGMAKYL